MAKFIKFQGYDKSTYYINVETIRHVLQSPQQLDRSLIRFVGDEHTLAIDESAANFVSRAGALNLAPDAAG
jgi:hypothetical protein